MYGSLTTAIVVMFSLEVAATLLLLLLGAQVIAEYERVGKDQHGEPPQPKPVGRPPSSAAIKNIFALQ